MITTRFTANIAGLHTNNMRTAIFNWAYARKHGGNFYLRVDDTYCNTEAIEKIVSGLKWLGLDYDKAPETLGQGYPGNFGPPSKNPIGGFPLRKLGPTGIIYQSIRGIAYMEALSQLVKSELVYQCFCRSKCDCRNLTKREKEDFYANGSQWVYRIDVKAVLGKLERLTFKDEIAGEVSCLVKDIDDFIIVKPNGMPVRVFATVVDDAALQISQIVRGQGLDNTFRQLVLYAALDYNSPTFAHLPSIFAPNSSKKLNKKNARLSNIPVTISGFDKRGFSPDVVFNYLSYLGLDGEKIWNRETLVKKFDFNHCLRKPKRFDFHKLETMQAEYKKS